MKLTITLYSPIQCVQLDEQIIFKNAKINKITYITGNNQNRHLLFDIPALNTENTSYNGRQLHKYFYSLFVPPFPNNYVQFYNNNNSWDAEFKDDQFLKNFMIYVYQDNGEFETSISLDNPVYLEFEFEK